MRIVPACCRKSAQCVRRWAVPLALLVAALAMAGCPQPKPASTGSAAGQASAGQPATGSTGAAATAGAQSQHPPPAGDQAAPATGEAQPGDAASGTAEDEQQDTAKTGADAAQDEEAVERPARTAAPDFIPIDVRFVSADFNDAPSADLSKLRFEFRAKLDRVKYVESNVELTSAKDVSFAVLKLQQCIIEFYPQVTDPTVRGRVVEGHTNYQIEGRYVLLVRTLKNELIGKFTISALEGMRAAPPEHWAKGYGAVLRYLRDERREDGYDIRRTDTEGRSEKSDALFGLRFDGVGYETLDALDEVGNKFTYQFPRGQLRLLILK